MSRENRSPHKPNPFEGIDSHIHGLWIIGFTLRGNVEFFAQVGQTHMDDLRPEVAQQARDLYLNVRQARRTVKKLMRRLNLQRRLRTYAWPVLRRNNSDLQGFWQRHFEDVYTGLEERMKKLALLVQPEEYEKLLRDLELQRPRLDPPRNRDEWIRARIQRVKGALCKRMPEPPMPPGVKILIGKNTLNNYAETQSSFSAYAFDLLEDLPRGEREKEKKELKKLFAEPGTDLLVSEATRRKWARAAYALRSEDKA